MRTRDVFASAFGAAASNPLRTFLLTLAILQQSDAIAPLATAVADRFAAREDAPFRVLPVALGIEVAPFGLVTRSGGTLPPVAERVMALVLEAGEAG